MWDLIYQEKDTILEIFEWEKIYYNSGTRNRKQISTWNNYHSFNIYRFDICCIVYLKYLHFSHCKINAAVFYSIKIQYNHERNYTINAYDLSTISEK